MEEIVIEIVPQVDLAEDKDVMFGVQIFDAMPNEAKVSRKNVQRVRIVTDHEQIEREKRIKALIDSIKMKEKPTWT